MGGHGHDDGLDLVKKKSVNLAGEEKHQDMGDHRGHGHHNVDKDGHHHNHHHGHGGHGHHHLTDKELNWRCRLFVTLEEPDFSMTARIVSLFINACLFLSVLAFMMGTMPEFKHTPYHCHPHMVVGYTCWDGYGNPTKVTPVDPHHPEQYQAAHAEYLEYKKKKKEKEAKEKEGKGDTKAGGADYPPAAGGGGGYPPAAGAAAGGAAGYPPAAGGAAGGAGYPPAAAGAAAGGAAGYPPAAGGAAGYPPAAGGAGYPPAAAAPAAPRAVAPAAAGAGYPPAAYATGYPPAAPGARFLFQAEEEEDEEDEELTGVSTYMDYYDLSQTRRFGNGDPARRRLAPKKKYKEGEPYCEEICELEPDKEIEIAEGFAMAAFTVDYLTRLFTAHAVPWRVLHPEKYVKDRSSRHIEPSGWKKTISYFFHPMMIVDFLALAPYYFKTAAERLPSNLASAGMLRSLRIIRIFRVAPLYMHMVVVTRGVVKQADNPTFMRCFDLKILFNALRLGDYAAGAPLFFTTIRASLPAIMVAIIALLCMTMMFGTALYVAERGTFRATPEFPNGAYLLPESATDKTLVQGAHTNIFMSMWFVISDTTTMPAVGMLEPKTILGEAVNVVTDYLSLLVLTLPIAIIGRNFHLQYESFFRNWDNEDYWSSSSDSDDEGEADALDDYDTAMAKLKNDQVNSSLGLNGPGPGTPLHALAEEGKVAAEDAVRRAPKPLKL